MRLGKKFWKLALGIAGWAGIIVCLTTVTFSWFAVNNNLTPGSTVSTKAVSTSAKVYQDNSHSNDDSYATSPTSDAAGTLSYDHAKGGRAVDYFIEMGGSTLQMYENSNNNDDRAAYFNIKFSSAWRIRDAAGNSYGFDAIHPDCPMKSHFSASGSDISSYSSYCDVYFNSSNLIWITAHSEVTVSDELGAQTGYYIVGDSDDPASSLYGHDSIVDAEHAIPMYVNAAANTTDLAFYAGLRLSEDDTFSVVSGDTLAEYTAIEAGVDNLLNSASYFTASSGVFTCKSLGYYSVALTQNSTVFVNEWDGYEVDGTTPYTVKDSGGTTLNSAPAGIGRPTRKAAATFDNTKLNYIGFQMTNYDAYGYYWIHIWGGASDTTWPGRYLGYQFGTDYVLWFDASAYVGWTGVKITRRSSSSTNSTEWAATANIEYSANTKNFYKVTWTDGSSTLGHSEERRSTIQEYYVKDGVVEGSANATGYCWNSDSYTPASGATPTLSGYTFKGWFTDSACISSWESGTNVAHDRNLYAKFVTSKTVSFSGYKMDTSVTVSSVKPAQSVDYGSTFTFPAMPTPPTGYKLYDSKWHISTSSSSTSYAVGATSPSITGATTYYVLYEKLPECTITYYKTIDGAVSGSAIDTVTAYQTASYTTRALPANVTGYTRASSWNTAPDGSGTSYSASSSITVPSQSTLTLYACFTTKNYSYYLTGSAKGNWGTGSGAISMTATHAATSVTWNNVSFTAGETWKPYRPAYSEFNSGNATWWDATTLASNSYFVDDGTNDHNIKALFAGTFNISLTVNTGAITITRVSLSATNFPLKKFTASEQAHVSASSVAGQAAQFTYGTVTFARGVEYFVRGPSTSYAWGYNNLNAAAQAYFDTGTYDADYGSNVIYAMQAKVSFTATVGFNFDSNTITMSGFAITSTYSIYEDGDGDGSGYASIATGAPSGTTVTFTNVTLNSGDNWYVAIEGSNRHAGYAQMPANITMLDTSAAKSTYFYQSSNGGVNISTGWGGTYTIVCNALTGQITSVACTALSQSDMVIVASRHGSITSFDSLSSNVWTYSSNLHLYLGETLHLKNNNTKTTSGGISCERDYLTTNDLSITYESGLDKYFKIDSGKLKARVDLTINFTFTLNKANTAGTLHITSATENTDVSFNHARDAGIYIEFADNSSFEDSTLILMHTTSGVDIDGNTYRAQEAPTYTTSSTTYMRIVVTHSNSTGSTPSGSAAIRAATETYYYTQRAGHTHSGFADGSGYIAVSIVGTWTISLQQDYKIVIENFSGAQTSSVEHNVPYYLLGQGMPGSELRDNDFTIPGGEQLWTYGGNSSTLPCYVGKYGSNTSSSNYVGTGISLKAGDTFALSNAAGLLTSFASASSDVSINNSTHIVTVNTSATYRIYLTGSIGSETIHIEKVSNGSSWTRDGNQVGGLTVLESNGASLTFGGNLDYSLLDAYGSKGYSFVVELTHTSAASGTMAYQVTNGNGFAITVDKSDNAYATNLSYSNSQSIAGGANNTALSRSISIGNNATCLRITIPPEAIYAMLSSGSYSFSVTIACQFQEAAIS